MINRKIDEMNLMIAIINTVGAILLLMFFRNRPLHPASNSDVWYILVYKEYSERYNNEINCEDAYIGIINYWFSFFGD